MADHFSPTVIQPTIPGADITPLERLLLSHIFQVEPDGEGLYFYADEVPADTIWLDRLSLQTALAQSNGTPDTTAVSVVTEQLAQLPADNVEIELDFSDRSWQSIFQDIVRRSSRLRYVTADPLLPVQRCGPTVSAAWPSSSPHLPSSANPPAKSSPTISMTQSRVGMSRPQHRPLRHELRTESERKPGRP